jgi:hypothetical protein
MTGNAEHIFFDGFFYSVSVVVFMLIAIDWWIGQAGRQAMRDKMVMWWDRIDDMTFTVLAAEDAGRVRRGFEFIFGSHWFGFRAILLTFLFSVVILIFVFGLGIQLSRGKYRKTFMRQTVPSTLPITQVGIFMLCVKVFILSLSRLPIIRR